jgi:tRNA dimethylallyltransferase
MSSQAGHPLIVIVGPTGSGKTALSLSLATGSLAASFGEGEIVSCDSVAVYREFEIGTAKPSREARAKVPHHLIDVASPNEPFTAGEYARQARQALEEIKARGRLPIVVGGTGLYLRALIDGLSPAPQRSEDLRTRLRDRAARKGTSYLHSILKRLDPSAAETIHPNDLPKIIRAVEICLSEGEAMTTLWGRGRDPLQGFRLVKIGLNPERKLLYERINARGRRMFEEGLVEETRTLLSKYEHSLSQPNSPINALGYRQAVSVLREEMSADEAVAAAQQAHRNYAKRQLTWFRSDPNIEWLTGFGDDADTEAKAGAIANEALA